MPQVTIYISPATVSSWTAPADCIKIDSVDCFGAAGSGAASVFNASADATGGGGGAFSRKNNIPTLPGTVHPLAVGLGGAGVSGTQGGQPGGDTWFGSGPLCLAKGGSAGRNDGTGGAGGQAASGIGDVRYSGGRGGNATGGINEATAGGGCAGPSGNGINGQDTSTRAASLGGAGDNYAGGAGSGGAYTGAINASQASAAGGTGTELGSGFGCGGGSGNALCSGTASAVTGTGGQFGGASGGALAISSTGSAQSGQAHHGFIVIRYTPVIKVPPFNIPMMGL